MDAQIAEFCGKFGVAQDDRVKVRGFLMCMRHANSREVWISSVLGLADVLKKTPTPSEPKKASKRVSRTAKPS